MKFQKITTALSLFATTFTLASQLPTLLQEASNAELQTSSGICNGADCKIEIAVLKELCPDYETWKTNVLEYKPTVMQDREESFHDMYDADADGYIDYSDLDAFEE